MSFQYTNYYTLLYFSLANAFKTSPSVKKLTAVFTCQDTARWMSVNVETQLLRSKGKFTCSRATQNEDTSNTIQAKENPKQNKSSQSTMLQNSWQQYSKHF